MATRDDLKDYLRGRQEEGAARGRSLHRRILALRPAARFSLRYRMPTYDVEGGWIAWAAQKSYFSVYTCATEKIESYVRKHRGTRCGKGCLNLPYGRPFQLRDLDAVIRAALPR